MLNIKPILIETKANSPVTRKQGNLGLVGFSLFHKRGTKALKLPPKVGFNLSLDWADKLD